jgi:OPA family glycerol-3-phosphate transporter-like MFS transporter 3
MAVNLILQGLFISGILGDRFNLRKVLFIGTMLTSITMFMFGCISEWFGIYSKTWYIALWIINGFAQSTGWPTVVAIMGNWFSKSGRGLIFGAWSANASVGNIIGALMVAGSLKYGYQVYYRLNAP